MLASPAMKWCGATVEDCVDIFKPIKFPVFAPDQHVKIIKVALTRVGPCLCHLPLHCLPFVFSASRLTTRPFFFFFFLILRSIAFPSGLLLNPHAKVCGHMDESVCFFTTLNIEGS